MKIYIICYVSSGVPFSIGKKGKTAGYTTLEEAEDVMGAISRKYEGCLEKNHSGLFVDTLEGSESLLSFSGFAW